MRECCLVPKSVCECLCASPSFTMPVLKLLSDPSSVRTQVSCCCARVSVLMCIVSVCVCCSLFAALWRLLSPAAICQGDTNWLNLLLPTWREKQDCFCRFTLSCLCCFYSGCVLYCCTALNYPQARNSTGLTTGCSSRMPINLAKTAQIIPPHK